jgi:hypothetical protein
VLRPRTQYSLYFSLLAGNSGREEFALDWVHRHPVFAFIPPSLFSARKIEIGPKSEATNVWVILSRAERRRASDSAAGRRVSGLLSLLLLPDGELVQPFLESSCVPSKASKPTRSAIQTRLRNPSDLSACTFAMTTRSETKQSSVCRRSLYEEIRVTYTAQSTVYKEHRKEGECKVIEASSSEVPKWWGAESSNQAPGFFRRADPQDRKKLRASFVDPKDELTFRGLVTFRPRPRCAHRGHGIA